MFLAVMTAAMLTVAGPAGAWAATAQTGTVSLNSDWKYAGNSKINSGAATLYRSEAAKRKGKVVCVNAGHGTSGGGSVKTLCHPDGSAKVTGGTTGAGATSAVAVSSGMTFSDGTPESKVTLSLALALKEKLLARGYDVLMIRESDDVQLDNIARTVIANNAADCHVALHWDSTTSNKGAFYMSVPNVSSYRSMEPVASHWQQHHALGESLISGLKGAGVKIFSSGRMDMDLTQTSYSTIPSVDIELGDKASDHSKGTIDNLAQGLADGIDQFFANEQVENH
jgi:N-acetylmuramoyl-L-alanine amidase